MKSICKKYCKLCLYSIIIFNLGCNGFKSKKIKYQNFPKTITIEIDSISIAPVLFNENKLVASNDFLVSMNVYGDTIYRVFSLPDLDYLGCFGFQGNGPNEFVAPSISSFGLEKDDFVTGDIKSLYITELPHNSKVNNQSVLYKRRYLLPGAFMPPNNCFLLSDTLICSVKSTRSEKELVYYNSISNETGYMIDFPNLYPSAPKDALARLYHKHVKISNDKSKIAMVYQLLPMMRIYDVKKKKTHELFINEGPRQKEFLFDRNQLANGIDLYSYYESISVTDNYIYAFFQSKERAYKENSGEIITIPLTEKQLHVFDWEGKPVVRIILKDWMRVYTPTQDERFIYFINPFREDMIYRFSLSKIF